MRRVTAGRLEIEQALPREFRASVGTLDKAGVQALFEDLAARRPEVYRRVAKRLSDVGREAAFQTGSFSFGLRSLLASPGADRARGALRAEIDRIRADRSLSDDARDAKVVEALSRGMKPLETAVYDDSVAEGNPLAMQIRSGARGNRMNLRSLRAGDVLYSDARDRPIPIPVLRSYSEGLSPVEYWAGAYGARKGIVDVKKGVADAGYLSKLLANAAHDLVVTAEDEDSPSPGVLGLPVDTDDRDSAGALLAVPAGGYPRNTVLTPAILGDLRARNIDRIVVRSPIAGGPPGGGVYARDVGVRERGGLSPRGEFVGIAAAQSIGERVSQSSLGSKHSGGVAGAAPVVSGFKYIQQLTAVPKKFPGGAAHAQADGVVQSVREAPQGGMYVAVAGRDHYVPAGQRVIIEPGTEVEAGDVLSDGIPNPAELVAHKGIGEGRRLFVEGFRRALDSAGVRAERRNVELLARGLIDHVRMTDEHDEYGPDDVVGYSRLAASWRPRDGAAEVEPSSAVGKYLERPALHHTIGTRVTRSMVPDLERFGVGKLLVHSDPPPFVPEMVRAAAQMEHHPDWMTRQLGSNVRKSLLDAAATGAVSDPLGMSYVPAVAERVRFGRAGALQPDRGTGMRDGDGDGYVEDGTPRMRPA